MSNNKNIDQLTQELEVANNKIEALEAERAVLVNDLQKATEAVAALTEVSSVTVDAEKPIETPTSLLKVGNKKYKWQYGTTTVNSKFYTAVDLQLPENEKVLEQLISEGSMLVEEK